VFILLALVVSIFMVNLKDYNELHAAGAIQPRYLLSVAPVILVATVASFSFILRKARTMKLTLLVVGLLIFTQGGGLITHIMRSDDSWDWDNKIVHQINDGARDILKTLVKE